MLDDLNGKKVIILGGTGLIGRALIKGFRDAGAETLAVGLTSGDKQFDLGRKDDSIADRLLELEKPDVVVNCAYPKDPKVHLGGFLWLTLRAAEHFKARNEERLRFEAEKEPDRRDTDEHTAWQARKLRVLSSVGGGAIVNFASIYGVVAPDVRSYEGTYMFDQEEFLAYCAVKRGIIGGSQMLAAQYAPFGIRINCISPGGVSDNQPFSFVEDYCRRTPMGRMARPEDLVGPTLFLASEASAYITGQNILVDGGLSCW